MKSCVAALAFLTRLPVGRLAAFDAADVGRSAAWFPIVGLLLGALYAGAARLLVAHLPVMVVSVLLVALDAVATGALHFDGLADTADGFGGGKDREDVLRIMHDHAIGSYGAVALVLVVALRITAYAALLGQRCWMEALVLTPALGRWSILLLSAVLPYARSSRSAVDHMNGGSVVWGTAVVSLAIVGARSARAWIAMAVVVAVTAAFGLYCRRRIEGITGDTLGANVQLCEGAALLAFLWG